MRLKRILLRPGTQYTGSCRLVAADSSFPANDPFLKTVHSFSWTT